MRKIFLLLFIFVFSMNFVSGQVVVNDTTKSKSLVETVEVWYDNNMNYASVFLLMTVESSFIPFPSEVVIPPAAYIASKPESKLNIFLVVLFGTLGALLGAYINYFLALWLGRPIMYRFADSKIGNLLLLSSEKIIKAEEYFNKHGKVSTFVGRLVPGIRQLISIPAGLSRMNLLSFTLYTLLGATIWNVILALLGYLAHGQADMIHQYSHELSMIILGIVGLMVVYFGIKFIIKKTKK